MPQIAELQYMISDYLDWNQIVFFYICGFCLHFTWVIVTSLILCSRHFYCKHDWRKWYIAKAILDSRSRWETDGRTPKFPMLPTHFSLWQGFFKRSWNCILSLFMPGRIQIIWIKIIYHAMKLYSNEFGFYLTLVHSPRSWTCRTSKKRFKTLGFCPIKLEGER